MPPLGYVSNVQYQRQPAVSQDRGPGERAGIGKVAAQRLDHDLLGVEHRINDQTETAAPRLQDEDEHTVWPGCGFRCKFEDFAEVNDRQQLASE